MTKMIAIANTLKPVDDVRAFEKIAQSITKTNKYEVNIIGNFGKKESGHPRIQFYPHSVQKDSLFHRILIREKILFRLIKMNPDLVIITTHELINTALILKLIRGTSIVYDVQEDYKKNILLLSTLPKIIKSVIANAIRLKERFSTIFISQYWLAEKCYSYEINFTTKKTIIVENKAKFEEKIGKKNSICKVLFSGTISPYSEVLLALELYKKIACKIGESIFSIIGQCHDLVLTLKLKNIAKADDRIKLYISSNSIPHEDIIHEIFSSDFGIISYQENEVNKNKTPTKLYEYSRYKLPYLIQNSTSWEIKSRSLGGAISIDFRAPNMEAIDTKLANRDKLFDHSYPIEETWESQEPIIINSIKTLLDEV